MNLFAEADLVQFQNRRYSPDEKRLLLGGIFFRIRKYPEANSLVASGYFYLQEVFI